METTEGIIYLASTWIAAVVLVGVAQLVAWVLCEILKEQ